MQRSESKSVRRWNANRSASIVMLGLSIIAIMLVVKIVIEYSSASATNKRLAVIKNQVLAENEYLEKESELLHDNDYYSIYIKEEFQLNGNNVITLPKD